MRREYGGSVGKGGDDVAIHFYCSRAIDAEIVDNIDNRRHLPSSLNGRSVHSTTQHIFKGLDKSKTRRLLVKYDAV